MRTGRGRLLRWRHGIDFWFLERERKEGETRHLEQEEANRGKGWRLYDDGQECRRHAHQRRWSQVAGGKLAAPARCRAAKQNDHESFCGFTKCRARSTTRGVGRGVRA